MKIILIFNDINKPIYDMTAKEEKRKKYFRVGRPPKYETAEELQDAIADYFENGVAKRKVLVGPPNNRRLEEIPVPTISGLVLHCGFADRVSFYDLEKTSKFSYTIKSARSMLSLNYEELASTVGGSAIIFMLKNFGFVDKSTLEHDVTDDFAARMLRARKKFIPDNED